MNQHHEDDEIFDIPTSKKNIEIFNIPTSQRNSRPNDRTLSFFIFTIIYNFCWGLLFLLFRHYNDQSCDSIDTWSFNAEIFLFFVTGYKLIIELPIQYTTNRIWKEKLFDIIDYIELFFSTLILIGLTYAYLQNEECIRLRMFILSYLIVTYFIIFIWILTIIYQFCNKDRQSRRS